MEKAAPHGAAFCLGDGWKAQGVSVTPSTALAVEFP
jgi:hypothetical protein